MASPKTLAIKAIGMVSHTFHIKRPKDQVGLGVDVSVTRQKPKYKVGRVIWTGGTKIGSFPKKD